MHQFWSPTDAQVAQAKASAEPFIEQQLGITVDEQRRRKVKAYGFIRDGKRIIHLQYYDPVRFPDWERMSAMLGGFPAYFAISLDPERWTVVGHYASPR